MQARKNAIRSGLIFGMLLGVVIFGVLLHSALSILIAAVGITIFLAFYFIKYRDVFSHPVAMRQNNRGVKHLRSGELDKAIECFDLAITAYPQFGWAYGNRGLTWLMKDNLDNAIVDINKAIQLKPKLAQNYSNRAAVFLQQREYDKALADANYASTLNPKNFFTFVVRGRIFLAQGQIQEAISAFKRAVNGSKKWGLAYNELAGAYIIAQDFEQALNNYNISIGLEPKNASYYNNRAYLYYSRTGEYSKALADCNKALELNPKLVYAYGTRGHTYFLMQKYDEGLLDFAKALELKPKHKFAIVGQALCQYMEGHLDEAKQLWQSLVEIDTGYNTLDPLIKDYQPAADFVETAQKLINNLTLGENQTGSAT